MPEPAAATGGKAPVARWAIHTLLLFAAMAAPFFLLDPEAASLAAVGVGLLYYLAWAITYFLRDRRKPKPPARVRLLINLYGLSVPTAAFGLLLFLIVEWLLWAYRPLSRAVEFWNGGMIALVAIAATTIVPAILFLLLAPRLARTKGGPASRFLAGVHARGFGWFQADWLSNTVGWAGSFGLISVFFTGALLALIHRFRDDAGVVTAWELVMAYPVLPFALLAVAAMQPLAAVLFPDSDTNEDLVRAYIDGTEDEPQLDPRTRNALGGLTAVLCVAGLLAMIYPIHLGMTAMAVADGVTAINGVVKALAILKNTHEDDDWTTTEFADAINRFGSWTPDAPDAGLGSLVADAGEVFPETCTVRIAAGTIAIPPPEPDNHAATQDIEPELRACLSVACTPPFTWSAPPALLLITSHASEAEGWLESLYADFFAQGVAAAPGGYCTADGELAESYQG